MSGVNKVILVGRLGKEPDIRYTPDGKAIANITMATSETWKDKKTGQKQEKTEWHRVVFFGGVAQIVADYVKKGSNIYIEGKLTTRKWQDQSGQDKYTTEIVVDGFSGTMQMLDGKNDKQKINSAQQSAPQQNQSYQPPGQKPDTSGVYQPNQPHQQTVDNIAGGFDEIDDDIPF